MKLLCAEPAHAERPASPAGMTQRQLAQQHLPPTASIPDRSAHLLLHAATPGIPQIVHNWCQPRVSTEHRAAAGALCHTAERCCLLRVGSTITLLPNQPLPALCCDPLSGLEVGCLQSNNHRHNIGVSRRRACQGCRTTDSLTQQILRIKRGQGPAAFRVLRVYTLTAAALRAAAKSRSPWGGVLACVLTRRSWVIVPPATHVAVPSLQPEGMKGIQHTGVDYVQTAAGPLHWPHPSGAATQASPPHKVLWRCVVCRSEQTCFVGHNYTIRLQIEARGGFRAPGWTFTKWGCVSLSQTALCCLYGCPLAAPAGLVNVLANQGGHIS